MLESRWSSSPILRPVRTASCAAAMLSSRPSVTGNTIPGNNTALRMGTMGTASAGSGGNSTTRGAEVVDSLSAIKRLC
jgi:hypothetical protein